MILASKNHTVGDTKLWTVDYTRWLANASIIQQIQIDSDSATCTVGEITILGPEVSFLLTGGELNERVNLALTMTDDLGNIKHDTIAFYLYSPLKEKTMKTKQELEDMTKDELVGYADDNDIEVHHHWVKDEIIKEIMKAEKAAAKQEAKQEDEPAAAQQQTQQSNVSPEPVEYQKPSPELAALQEQAQKLPDPNTRFAPAPIKEVKNG